MIVKILGIIDIITAILFWVFAVFEVSYLSQIILLLGFVILMKGIIFSFDFNIVSIIDILISFVIIYASTNTIPFIAIIILSIYLLQKGIFSLLA